MFINRGMSIYIQENIAAAAKSLQSCPTLCDPTDGSPPGSSLPGILQARILEWVAISFSNAWKWKVKVKSLSRVRLLATPWTACSLPGSSVMGFSRQEYWSGLPLPSLTVEYNWAFKDKEICHMLQHEWTLNHHVKWSKPVTKRQILHD